MATLKQCKLCGNDSRFAYSIENQGGDPSVLDVYLCCDCGLLFVGTPITSDQLANAYGAINTERYYREVDGPTNEKARRAIADLSPLLVEREESCSLLDVGCGNGIFLRNLRAAYPEVEAAGHELPGSAAAATEEAGFKVFVCPLDSVDTRFSIVTLLDVAEHLQHPDLTFVRSHALLRDHGHIYIHTPRRCFWDELALRFVKLPVLQKLSKAWLRSRVSIFHLQLWSDEALQRSLSKAGFRLSYLRAETELSWPLETYAKVYLGNLPFRAFLVKWTSRFATVLFVRLGTLRNKAVCLAEKSRMENGVEFQRST